MTLKINVLGTEYTLEVVSPNDDKYLADKECDGYCDSSSHRIVISTCPDNDLDDLQSYIKAVKRHEIVHAFLNESGLQASWEHKPFGHEETVVDWIALQFPKLYEAFKVADAL